jgi:hypothetical protein
MPKGIGVLMQGERNFIAMFDGISRRKYIKNREVPAYF